MPVNSSIKLKVFQRDKYRCVECGTNSQLTVDHIVPSSRGGSDLLDNLQTMCKACNLKKGNNHRTFWQKLFGFATPLDIEITNRDTLNAVKVGDTVTLREVQSMTNKRLNEIEPKVHAYIDELLKKNPLTEIGLKNSIDGYGKRSEERDRYLKEVVFLLCNKVEELENRIEWMSMTPAQRATERRFREF